MMEWKLLVQLLLLLIVSISQCIEPPTITVDRDWSLPEFTKVGTIVKTVRVQGENNETIVYSLELDDPFSPNKENPFWIHPTSGYVYLNKSLEGQANQQSFILSVGANDGTYSVKNQVRVSITGINGNTRKDNFVPPKNIYPKLPDFGSLPSNRGGASGGFFFPSSAKPTKINVTGIESTQNKTYIENKNGEPIPTPPSKTFTLTTETSKIPMNTETVPLAESQTIIPIIIAFVSIFLVASLIAIIIFRKQICRRFPLGRRFKKNKVDKAKKSNQSVSVITLSDESSRNSMVMQHWQGPLAYGNRYTPWANSSHDVVHSSSSFSYSGGDIKVAGYDRWEFPRHRLKVFNILGEGAFGQVWRCEAQDIDGIDGVSTVAVKTLKENATESEKKDLMSELHVMKSLEPHVNVVRLLGCCTEKDPIFVIIEYVALGKLQTYLRDSRVEKNYDHSTSGKSQTLTSRDLVSFMYQVARGMEFLSSRQIIHRDLAARNILITEDYTCKIADFGFARDIETSTVYERKTGGRQPIRWMAIESLYDNIFSVKSDIWSFGILMWEIATLGATPYPGMGAADVMKKVREGYRLEKPEHTSREIYNYMYYCWDADSTARPDFSEIRQNLDNMLSTATDYIELERFPDHDYYNILHNTSGEKL